MLRNSYKIGCTYHLQKRHINVSTIYAKSNVSLGRQGKVMSKLFGERLSGSKKRWYPIPEASHPKHGGNLIFETTQLSKPGGAGKNSSRRCAVLNKLFMEQISSILATGAIADSFLGRGLQLTRVKISPDFTCVNVYWLGIGDPQHDGQLGEDLKRNSGLLRHELSQLRVIGVVPRIHFVRDKTFANIDHVETLLKNMKLGQDDKNKDEEANRNEHIKNEFYGQNASETESSLDSSLRKKPLPTMRHDVFGLDHQELMSKILTKMRKTKQAWETHAERMENKLQDTNVDESTTLKIIKKKIQEKEKFNPVEFNKFLAQRHDRRNTPERKKHRKLENISVVDRLEVIDNHIVASKHQRRFLGEEDYLHDDNALEEK